MIDKALESSIEDIGKRQKSLLPTWLIGTGAEFGTLLPYSKSICFTLLVKVFYQELYDDLSRTREDLINSTTKICNAFHVHCSYGECEKIVDSLLWSGSKNYTFAFEESYFDDKSNKWEIFQFQYFEIDRDVSDLESGLQIYKLSMESQEIVLKSHEIIEEMDISIQQLVAELLIKKGNLKSALRIMDALDFRVRKLINAEKAHKEELIRNPKQAILNHKSLWGKQLNEVKEQFNDELSRYSQMDRILNKIGFLESQKTIFLQLKKRISKTRNLHDLLAKIVIENIRLELEILNNEFKAMWLVSGSSFRKNVWEESILPNGFDNPDDMITLAELILPPKRPFLFPIEWGLAEQHSLTSNNIFDNDDGKNKKIELNPIVLDWENIVFLWEPVFLELLKTNYVSIDLIKNLDDITFTRWIQHKEALDFWLAFNSMETPLIITSETLDNTTDDRITLICKLIEKNNILKGLIGKELSSISSTGEILVQDKIKISKYNLLLKEVKQYDTK